MNLSTALDIPSDGLQSPCPARFAGKLPALRRGTGTIRPGAGRWGGPSPSLLFPLIGEPESHARMRAHLLQIPRKRGQVDANVFREAALRDRVKRDGGEVERRTGELADLIETEERLRERLGKAEDEAARLVAEARRHAEETAARADAEAQAALERLEREIEAEAERERARIEEAARRQAEAFERFLAQGQDELVEHIVNRVIGPDVGEEPTLSVKHDHRDVEGAGSRPAR